MIRKIVLIAAILILLVSYVSFASVPEEDLNSLSSAIKSNPADLSSTGRNALVGIGGDFLNIARYIVITTLLVRMVMLFIDFTNAGDNPQVRATIKSKTIWLSLGIVFAVNFWTVYRFMANTLSNLSF